MNKTTGPVHMESAEIIQYLVHNMTEKYDVFRTFLKEYAEVNNISLERIPEFLAIVKYKLGGFAICSLYEQNPLLCMEFRSKVKESQTESSVKFDLCCEDVYFGRIFEESEKYPKTMKLFKK